MVNWRSKTQDKASRSSVKDKFQTLAKGVCEGLEMKTILDNLKWRLTSL